LPASISICKALAQDLATWRLASKLSGADDPIIYGRQSRAAWKDGTENHWYGVTWPTALKNAKVKRDRPYVLRHSIVSLWIASGLGPAEVAKRAGHSQREMWDTYSHLFEDFDPAERVDIDAEIAKARACWTDAGLPISFPDQRRMADQG